MHHNHNNNAFRENTFDRETATHNAPAPHVGVMAVELDTLSHQRLRVGRERVRARVNVVRAEIIKPEVIDEERHEMWPLRSRHCRRRRRWRSVHRDADAWRHGGWHRGKARVRATRNVCHRTVERWRRCHSACKVNRRERECGARWQRRARAAARVERMRRHLLQQRLFVHDALICEERIVAARQQELREHYELGVTPAVYMVPGEQFCRDGDWENMKVRSMSST